MFLFSTSGSINNVLSWMGVHGPNWFNEPTGVITEIFHAFGMQNPPAALQNHGFLAQPWSYWLGGPSVAMSAYMIMAVFTTSGTFMLLFIAGLQNISSDTLEAASIDGAGAWTRFWRVTLPQLKPTIFMVLTLGLIGTWQVFDQMFVAGGQGNPSGTANSVAYLSYLLSFSNNDWGQGAAIAFILFVIIIAMTLIQRWATADHDSSKAKRRARKRDKARVQSALVFGVGAESLDNANKPGGN
jgi:multiple sugar transport system permease protein